MAIEQVQNGEKFLDAVDRWFGPCPPGSRRKLRTNISTGTVTCLQDHVDLCEFDHHGNISRANERKPELPKAEPRKVEEPIPGRIGGPVNFNDWVFAQRVVNTLDQMLYLARIQRDKISALEAKIEELQGSLEQTDMAVAEAINYTKTY